MCSAQCFLGFNSQIGSHLRRSESTAALRHRPADQNNSDSTWYKDSFKHIAFFGEKQLLITAKKTGVLAYL